MSRVRAKVSRRGRQRSQDDPRNNKRLIPLWPLCRSSVASVAKRIDALVTFGFGAAELGPFVVKGAAWIRAD
jgi:hypothetical protein